jgi:hypothetical protein
MNLGLSGTMSRVTSSSFLSTGAPVLDTVNHKLFMIGESTSGTVPFPPGLLRCEPDGSACASVPLGAGLNLRQGLAMYVDAANQRLVVAGMSNGATPTLRAVLLNLW